MEASKKHSHLFTLALIGAASVIFGMALAGGLNLTLPGRAAVGAAADDRPLHAAARAQLAASAVIPATIPASFADIADRVNPAVVSITSTETVRPKERGRVRPHGGGGGGGGNDPFEFFFGPRRFRDQPEEPHMEQSGGSGFLISDDGSIITNYHVVEGANRIKVNLSGDKRDYSADVVGTDQGTDLALIKIKVDSKLPFLSLGDSDVLRVGDWVLAVGNPLTYEHTVTVGVVSAKGRFLPNLSRDFSLDNFIQTDAAINFGNSGGPLVNLKGEVVGVNTAISSVGQGIGFAVPINIAKDIMDQLRTKGKVARGYLGISLGEITPDEQEAWGLKSDKGALVQEVKPGLPAEEAGVRRGDVIVAVDGRAVDGRNEVVRLISAKVPGSTVRLTVLRAGKEVTISAKLSDRATNLYKDEGEGGTGESEAEPNEKRLGIEVDDLTPQISQQLRLPREVTGVVVTDVSKVSPAYEKGIDEGDVIQEVNRVPIQSVSDYRREIRKVKEGGLVVLYVYSSSGRTGTDPVSRYVTIRLEKGD
jgi:serine protease Do